MIYFKVLLIFIRLLNSTFNRSTHLDVLRLFVCNMISPVVSYIYEHVYMYSGCC